MKVIFETVGNFEDTIRWLTNSPKKDVSRALDEVGKQGVRDLKAATPVGDTGDTANGWEYVKETTRTGSELSFVNTAHPEESVNVAVAIELGHGTGTGGYVPPTPYIKQAMNKTVDDFGERILREVMDE